MKVNTKPIRVLMVTSEWPKPGVNVTSHFIKRQAEFISAAGVEVTVFPFKGAKNPLNYLTNWVRLRIKLWRKEFDLVHAQFGQSGVLALPKRLPLVITFRGSDLLGTISDRTGHYMLASTIHRFLSRLVAAHADAVIVVAEHMKDQLHPSIKTHVIPSGLDLQLFRPTEKRIARTRLGLPLDEKLVLFVGRMNQARKRGHLAQRAVEVLNQSMSAKLVVAWRVPHTDIPLYMSACDALVFTSMQEGSPNVVKEALACNLPVVSVPVGDVATRLEGIEGCELCEDDNPEAIAGALKRVLKRGGRVQGRESVKHLDENVTTGQVLKIYETVLGRQSAPAKLRLLKRAAAANR
ncbi:MAG TPA: glycosyltransferase family 4 protein [Pyrinomonadaceae bacterium]|nr:glycosyltransferase family 4 protein [Pyrinomonadaceae bacterium]